VNSTRIIFSLSVISALFAPIPLASGETIQGILRGTVVMRDGSVPPFSVGIERICSDGNGSVPGPLSDKKGEYLWRMDFDKGRTRQCVLQATHEGYFSNSVDISAVDPVMDPNVKVAPLVLTPRLADPYLIVDLDDKIPSKALNAWRAAMKAVAANNAPEAATQLQAVVAAAPKIAAVWHTLGVVYDRQNKFPEAKDAYQHAIDIDPKMLQPYAALSRLCIRTKDWENALKITDALIKIDNKKVYQETSLHRAVAQYGLKNLADAETSVQGVIRQDPKRALPRAEFVLGRILEAKGDLDGAREHMTKYLELDPKVSDAEVIKAHLQYLGKPEASKVEPELEVL
jgi:tetratricopeptide (TPR) repeat protein